MAVNSVLETNLYRQYLNTASRTRNVLFKDLNETYTISSQLSASDPEWLLRGQWDYLVSVTFDGKDNNRGQLYINNTEIFDSYTTGNGTNRVTTAWGKVSASSMASPVGGALVYTLFLQLTGAGNVRINGPLTVQWVRVRK